MAKSYMHKNIWDQADALYNNLINTRWICLQKTFIFIPKKE